jgi:hypothetical protein
MPRISSSTASAALGRAAREDDDAAVAEGGLHDVRDALGQRADGDALVVLLGGALVHQRGGRLHLDDVRAQLGGDLRGVGHHVHGGLGLGGEVGAARVAPQHGGQAGGARLTDEVAQVAVLLVAQALPG